MVAKTPAQKKAAAAKARQRRATKKAETPVAAAAKAKTHVGADGGRYDSQGKRVKR